jgi:putative PEP-CTERM system TPR-repeat lipoprotein
MLSLRMPVGSSRSSASLAAVIAAVLVAACGSEKPEALVASAKQYMAKSDYRAAAIQLKNVLQKTPNDGEARYLLGLTLLETRDPLSAEKELRKALELQVPPEVVVPPLARALLDSGQAEKVVAELGDSTLSRPSAQAELQTHVGWAQISLGKLSEARAAFTKALVANPDYDKAKLGQARLLAAGGDLTAALASVDEVLARSPAETDALFLKGELLTAQGQPEAAVAAFERVIQLRPDRAAARQALISLLIDRREYDKAATGLAEAKKTTKGDPVFLYLEALLAARQGNIAAARESIQQVLKLAPQHVPSLVLAGAIEYESRSYAQAQAYLKKALDRAPRNVSAQRLLVASYLRAGQPDRALDALQPLFAQGSPDPVTLSLAGEAYLANNDLKTASEYFEKASAADEKNARTRTRFAQVRLALGDAERGMKELEAASQADADSVQPDVVLILSHLRRNEVDKALVATASLEKKQPKNPLTHNLKGLVYLAKRDPVKARSSFETALELQPSYLPAVQNLASLDLQAKNPDAARKRFEEALTRDPGNARLLLGYAELLRTTGADPKFVRSAIERAVKSDPSSVGARVALVESLLRSGDTKKALIAAQEASVAAPNDPRVLEALGVAQQAAGDVNQAIATFQKLASTVPRSASPLLRLAGAYVAAKDYTGAVQALRKALSSHPNLVDLHREIALLLVQAGRPEEALGEARAVQKQRPKEAIGFVVAGDVYVTQKNWAEASSAYRQAFKLAKTPSTLMRLHTALQAAGQGKEAEQAVAKWLSDNPKDVAVRTYLAERELREKDYRSAASQYRTILAQAPNNAIALNNLAWAAGQLEDPQAVSYAEEANRLAPGSPAVLDTLGWLLVQKGDASRGLEYLQRASDLAPTSHEIRLHLATALAKTGQKESAKRELETLLKAPGSSPHKDEASAMLKSL